ncbi:MAG: hypothetical protein QNJ40_06115, partial [Xanthomonadales bacterium]|nr:hypothetical protein [Xanthomonadales bacterium]
MTTRPNFLRFNCHSLFDRPRDYALFLFEAIADCGFPELEGWEGQKASGGPLELEPYLKSRPSTVDG